MTKRLSAISEETGGEECGCVNCDTKCLDNRHPAEGKTRAALTMAGVLAVRLIGPPGTGKTEFIEAMLKSHPAPQRVAVICVNPASGRDAKRLELYCGHVQHIDAPVPRAAAIWEAVSKLPLDKLELIVIEGSSGMAELTDIGQDVTAAVMAISAGDDKAVEYVPLLKAASAVLLTKSDMRALVKFDENVFRQDVSVINPEAEIFVVSAFSGAGMGHWMQWLEHAQFIKRSRGVSSIGSEELGEHFMG
jgi:hydrogenase nickel incorporation protein HypB